MTGAEVPGGKRSSTASSPATKRAKLSSSNGTREMKITDFVKVLPASSSPSTTPQKSSQATVDNANQGPKQPPTVAQEDLGIPQFNPKAFLDSLSIKGSEPTVQDLLKLECMTLESSWLALLQKEITKDYFLNLKRFLWTEGVQGLTVQQSKVFPPAKDIYSWSRYCPLDKVKVVVIGQDPYHDNGQAHGLSFSVRPGVAVPPSLRNIYKELSQEYPEFVAPKNGDLTPWARSGVLLLNTSLTVRAHSAGSHSGKGWETFTDKVVDLVDRFGGSDGAGKLGKGVVFLAWGAWAAKRVARLDAKKHLILKSAHPSPLSAHRGFLGNGHFKKANEWLETKYGSEHKIEWSSVCSPAAPKPVAGSSTAV